MTAAFSPAWKRVVSAVVFSSGAAVGSIGCAQLPKAVFVIGYNDSPIALLLSLPCVAGFTPLCLAALWFPRFAGRCFGAFAAMWAVATFVQHQRMVKLGFETGILGDNAGAFFVSAFFAAYACFALWTASRGWPAVVASRKAMDQCGDVAS